jgi:hypothetical protein
VKFLELRTIDKKLKCVEDGCSCDPKNQLIVLGSPSSRLPKTSYKLNGSDQPVACLLVANGLDENQHLETTFDND